MLQMEQHTMDTITAWSAKATFGGAAFTIFSDLTLNGFATLVVMAQAGDGGAND